MTNCTIATGLVAKGLCKRFDEKILFEGLNLEATTGLPLALLGANGSGKSTLVSMLYGFTRPTAGDIWYDLNTEPNTDGSKGAPMRVPAADIACYASLCSPALTLPGPLPAIELLNSHYQMRAPTHPVAEMLDIVGLGVGAAKTPIRRLSSGQLQRVKLCIGMFDAAPIMFLDEPCTNLDASGIAMYQRLLSALCQTKLVVIASNDVREYGGVGALEVRLG